MSPSAVGMSTEVQIPGTVRHELLSRHTGRVYEISIGLPDGYGTAARYPVMYVLDGQWDFKLVMSVYGALCFDMFVPDAIVVGIAAGGGMTHRPLSMTSKVLGMPTDSWPSFPRSSYRSSNSAIRPTNTTEHSWGAHWADCSRSMPCSQIRSSSVVSSS